MAMRCGRHAAGASSRRSARESAGVAELDTRRLCCPGGCSFRCRASYILCLSMRPRNESLRLFPNCLVPDAATVSGCALSAVVRRAHVSFGKKNILQSRQTMSASDCMLRQGKGLVRVSTVWGVCSHSIFCKRIRLPAGALCRSPPTPLFSAPGSIPK